MKVQWSKKVTAAISGSPGDFEQLLEENTNFTQDICTEGIKIAARMGNKEVVETIISKRDQENNPIVDPQNLGVAFTSAATRNNVDIAQSILKVKDRNNNPAIAENRLAMYLELGGLNQEIVKNVVDLKNNDGIDVIKPYALNKLSKKYKDDPGMTRFLLEKGADYNVVDATVKRDLSSFWDLSLVMIMG